MNDQQHAKPGASAGNPALRAGGFHPTAVAGPLGALWAGQGVGAPDDIFERDAGMAQAFLGRRDLALALPPQAPFEILECCLKPYACCRHLQPAMEAVIELRHAHGVTAATIEGIDVEIYVIAAKHANTGWDDMAGAQLSFPYCLILELKFGRADRIFTHLWAVEEMQDVATLLEELTL